MHTIPEMATAVVAQLGYAGVFVWMMVSAFIPIPSEVVLPLAGALIVTQHKFTFAGLVIAGSLGNLAGSIVGYGIGAWKGREFFEKYGKYFLIRRKDIAAADHWFSKYGEATVFFTRMMPVIRAFISLPAGIVKMPFGKFCLYTLLGSIPWCLLLTWLGLLLGDRWGMINTYFHKADLAIRSHFACSDRNLAEASPDGPRTGCRTSPACRVTGELGTFPHSSLLGKRRQLGGFGDTNAFGLWVKHDELCLLQNAHRLIDTLAGCSDERRNVRLSEIETENPGVWTILEDSWVAVLDREARKQLSDPTDDILRCQRFNGAAAVADSFA